METRAIVTAEERGQLRAAVKSVRVEWRERLAMASRLSPNSKLAKKAGVLLLDLDSLDDRIQEAGGEDELVFVICAQVASGCLLADWCDHYGIERGLVWAFLTETPEREERYRAAQRGIADADVAETVALSDEATTEDQAVKKLQIETRFRRAGLYDRKRFGTEKAGGGGATVGMVIDAGLAFAASELLARIARPVLPEPLLIDIAPEDLL